MMRRAGIPITVVVLAAGAVAGGVAGVSRGDRASAATARPPGSTASIERRALTATVSESGVLTYGARADGSPYTVVNQAHGTYTRLPAVGGVIVLLTWMYLSMVVVLVGAELAAELMKGTGGVRSRAGHLYDGRISTGGPTDLPSVEAVDRAPSKPGRSRGDRPARPVPAGGVEPA